MQLMKLSVLIPVYNEAEHICQNLKETASTLGGFCEEFEIVVCDDGSADDSYAEALKASEEDTRIKVVRNPANEGKGFALKTAFQNSSGELVVFLDADLDLHPRLIEELIEKMERTDADVVIGSKFHADSELEYPFHRLVLSHIYAFVLWVLFSLPLRDTQTGLKLYKRKVLEKIFPRIVCRRFAFDVELLANSFLQGYKVVEAPVVIRFRRERRWGRIGLKTLLLTAQDTLAIFYRYYFLNYYRYERPALVSRPSVSIVIPCRGDTPRLRECVEWCRRQDYPAEIIIVTDTEIRNIEARVVVIRGLSPPRKRDVGARIAGGEVVAFLDDDASPSVQWLKAGMRHFQSPEIKAVGGPGTTSAGDSVRQRASGAIFSSALVSGTKAFRYIPKDFRFEDDHPSCNLFVRKSVLEEIGGFDTDYYPGEDTLLCKKLAERGVRIFYDPEASVYHHRRPVFRQHLKQVRNYAFQRGFFARTFRSTSLRFSYFIPTLLMLWLLAGWTGVFFLGWWKTVYLASVALYSAVCFVSAVRHLELRLAPHIFAGIILTHLTYGIYFVLGLLSREGLRGGTPKLGGGK